MFCPSLSHGPSKPNSFTTGVRMRLVTIYANDMNNLRSLQTRTRPTGHKLSLPRTSELSPTQKHRKHSREPPKPSDDEQMPLPHTRQPAHHTPPAAAARRT